MPGMEDDRPTYNEPRIRSRMRSLEQSHAES